MEIRKSVKAVLFLTVLFAATKALAQTDKLGSWNIANINWHINSKFSAFGELQVRSQKFVDDFFYHEIKAGINYYLPQKNSLSIGFGNYETYSYPGNFEKPVVASEFRIWEQFVL